MSNRFYPTYDNLRKIWRKLDYLAKNGVGGGTNLTLDSLYFSGTGTAEDPIVPLGFRGDDGLAYTYDGANIIILLANPAAPTGGLVDDTTNVFKNVTRNPEYPNLEDYEGHINIGGSAVLKTVTEQVELDANGFPFLSISVGNVDGDIGTVGIRVKAVTDIRNASPYVLNSEAYVAETQLIDAFTAYDSGNFVQLTIGDTTNNVRHQNAIYAAGRANYYFPVGVNGWLQFSIDGTEPTGDAEVSLSPNKDTAVTPGNSLAMMAYNWGNTRISVKNAVGNTNNTTNYPSAGGLLRIRMRLDADTIYYEVSDDGGSTWDSHGTIARGSADLYIKFYSQALPAETHNLVSLGAILIP